MSAVGSIDTSIYEGQSQYLKSVVIGVDNGNKGF